MIGINETRPAPRRLIVCSGGGKEGLRVRSTLTAWVAHSSVHHASIDSCDSLLVGGNMLGKLDFCVAAVAALGLSASAQAGDVCSLRGTAGTYIVRCSGFSVPSEGVSVPVAALILQKRERDGEISGSGTISFGGTIVPITITGTNEVKPDCTGTEDLLQSIAGGSPTPAHFNFVVGTDSTEIYGINTDPAAVFMCTDTRLTHERN
jgi:hypothetical protein